VTAGACPASHPVRMPQLALETMWDTKPFNDKSLWPADGSQPFVWSFDGNDKKGFGTHADYLFGCKSCGVLFVSHLASSVFFLGTPLTSDATTGKGDALQRTMDSQPLLSNGLKTQSVAESNKCTIQSSVKENIDGCKCFPRSPPK